MQFTLRTSTLPPSFRSEYEKLIEIYDCFLVHGQTNTLPALSLYINDISQLCGRLWVNTYTRTHTLWSHSLWNMSDVLNFTFCSFARLKDKNSYSPIPKAYVHRPMLNAQCRSVKLFVQQSTSSNNNISRSISSNT